MDSRIPLPTDSIYKFYALFGLLLFVFGAGSTVYVNHSTNELLYSEALLYEDLKMVKEPSSVDSLKKEFVRTRITIARENKDFFLKAIGIIMSLGVIAMAYGFYKWHRYIQPIQDETARLQLEKLRREVNSLTLKN